MPYRRKFLTRAGYTTLSALLTMGFLQKDKQKEVENTDSIAATYTNVNTPLRQLAAAKGKRYGAAVDGEFLFKEKDYANLIARECSIVTPNGELKWNATEPQPGQFTFESADAIANFCLKNNIELHGHTLFWHMGKPDWLPYPPTLQMIERHVTGVMGHYRNSPVLKSWDIANEIIADSENDTDNATYGLRRGVKPELIRDLFLKAASVDSSKKFYINDFGIEGATWKSSRFLKMVEYLKNSGAKIDCAGIQSHLWFSTAYGFDATGFSSVLKRLNDMRVKPVITELDIIIDTPLPDSIQKLDQMVADGYKRFLDICFAADVDTVITWGITDRHTWIRHPDWMPRKTYRDNPSLWKFLRPLPFDENLQPKVARNAIAQAFGQAT
ncbi:MAG: endo-1,4-beta-xylanase [Nostoc sp. DedVER02]|uniref:endo-1,4-beta-xylanase n=1 Tax=unclassified Nostoc TaxID=2593658 RepID=UPI002AD222B6|nr:MULTISPECIES: endo-1,4-beta-xylanase [unclassified Nostoc]MDZ7985781.1 endo-1,4-beta-xylanase [Nostoc sp. DedVER02]MDZ8114857.1 endo-1,4-beta-xylanase [Nostoc sp. DedVER01b]